MDFAYRRPGMDHHPLLISLANTSEHDRCSCSIGAATTTSLAGTGGRLPGHGHRATLPSRPASAASCTARGDTKFAQTKHLDRWDTAEATIAWILLHRIRGLRRGSRRGPTDLRTPRHRLLSSTAAPDQDLRAAEARASQVPANRPLRHGYEDIELLEGDGGVFAYRPTALCKKSYRMVVLRKRVEVGKGPAAALRRIPATSSASPTTGR